MRMNAGSDILSDATKFFIMDGMDTCYTRAVANVSALPKEECIRHVWIVDANDYY